MVNELILHSRFGKGKVIEVLGNHIKIDFFESKSTKIFQYPDSFEKYLTFENDRLQQEVLQDLTKICERKLEEETRKLVEYQKQEEERKKVHKVTRTKQRKK
ncbi:MAG: hypothetical protein K0S41_2308 [Anaerocolumna sp.]|jgi:hypothetical protein|nr:hypothetical protein [Anaerocolumna sp.]